MEVPEGGRASRFVALVGRLVYGLLGWTLVGKTPAFKKYVIIVAPHTSNWDGFLLLLAADMLRLNFSFFGKHTLFRGPLGWFLRARGGIPLDRSRNQSFVPQAVSWFGRHETFVLGVAPEGTRKWTPGWKTGFYYIAHEAGVPIVLAFIDYARKEAGILPEILVPSGDIEKDFETLKAIYETRTGHHPERKSPIRPLRRTQDDSRCLTDGEPA